MSYIEKEKLIKADMDSIENIVRHSFNQGYDLGFKDGKKKAKPQEPIAWIVGKNNAQIAVKNMSIDKLQKICAIIGGEQEPTTKIEESNFSQEQYLADIQSAYDCGKSVIDKLRAEIATLQNRCYALTKGTMCAFCKYECEYKLESEPQESESDA